MVTDCPFTVAVAVLTTAADDVLGAGVLVGADEPPP
jgi:hypothetical protein